MIEGMCVFRDKNFCGKGKNKKEVQSVICDNMRAPRGVLTYPSASLRSFGHPQAWKYVKGKKKKKERISRSPEGVLTYP